MSTTRNRYVFQLVLTLSLFGSSSFATALEADPPASTTSTEAAQDDDDNPAALVLAEPDYRIVNLPTNMRLPLGKGAFEMTHRFAGNLRRGSFSDQASSLFGIDAGATVGFEYRMGVAPNLEAVVFRTQFQRTIQFTAKYDFIRQRGGTPLSISPIVSVEGTDNFQEDYAPSVGATVSRRLGDVVAMYVVPMWVHNSAAAAGFTDDTFFLGVGGRLRIRPTVYVSAEVSPRLSGYAPGKAEYGFGLEKRAGGHMFQLNVTNSTATTTAQLARGGNADSLSLGFNLSRKFF